VRQNLALAVGLQGRFAEAESIARADLPPDEAAANVAYLSRCWPQGQPAHRRPRQAAGGGAGFVGLIHVITALGRHHPRSG
jgi:hypothetical protein